ncbi:hypothetical protein BV25DRAFT_1634477 [Artomyces pyxidatus]|uniref:Uncharacterized protein n=1 Tax=Artomyces pyxidatus TaxID=48021 RepID=A0ACB8SJ79_9AGAM|nr:hypothetical protein BV25DRAFT_1634477 [Artomyces pyxidatus]
MFAFKLQLLHRPSARVRTWSPSILYPFIFIVDQLLQRHRTLRDQPLAVSPADLAIVEALKLGCTLLSARYTAGPGQRGSDSGEERLLRDISNSDESDDALVPEGHGLQADRSQAHTLVAVSAAAVGAAHVYLISRALQSFDVGTVHLANASSVAFVIYGASVFFSRLISASVWQTVALQLSGLFLIKDGLYSSSLPGWSTLYLLPIALTTALAVLCIDFIYHSPTSTSRNRINIVIFTSGLCIHIVILISQYLFASHTILPWHLTLRKCFELAVRAFLELIALSVIDHQDALFERVLASSNIVLFFLAAAVLNRSVSLGASVGFVLAMWASISYTLVELDKHQKGEAPSSIISVSSLLPHQTLTGPLNFPQDAHSSTWRRRMAGIIVFAIFTFMSVLGIFLPSRSVPSFTASSDVFALPSQDGTAVCVRTPLHFAPLYSPEKREYKHFNDVLLVVFFSHARYDGNLDYYREVYAEYFPNMLFVGPASREDKGFDGSYDVLVDSYESSEDLNDPDFYKMAGRMAHHMLYTALQAHPCYAGYLWAPFDTLLNVPRLQQFDQTKFWYHSPFGTYVPNPAANFAERNRSNHAPPARISPDPALNLTDGWQGWGADWWWGDPHVGLSVCKPAFARAPTAERARLASFTLVNGTTRFVGGSADTLYIPGTYREEFQTTLARFLETTCFLEIAVPTAVHMVAPSSDDILFVDHWWIWEPPFNASFVREKWAAGYEVDTFHTFHWGDPDADGEWRASPGNVQDVRLLLGESARRQGVAFPNLIS